MAVTRMALCLVLLLGSTRCSTSSARPVLPTPVAQQRECTLLAPCDGVREQWFGNEAKSADLWANYCQPPAPSSASDCRGLEAATVKLHQLNVGVFSDFCVRFAGRSAMNVYPFVGRPDRDETASCGPTQCRIWLWYWYGGGRSGIFTMLLKPSPESTEWLLQRCNYCTPTGCSDMPATL